MTVYRIRPASTDDAATILRFIRELADYEKALHEVAATEEGIVSSLFGEGPVSRAEICETVGFAVWFKTYSTWQAKNGLYLEDLYVTPDHRGAGVGKMLLRHLARLALEEGCARFEWSVLDWNAPAIRVYDAIGAEPQSEWIRYRLTGEKLRQFAAG
jgi:GNAT superfamily N-acetyltransferase